MFLIAKKEEPKITAYSLLLDDIEKAIDDVIQSYEKDKINERKFLQAKSQGVKGKRVRA